MVKGTSFLAIDHLPNRQISAEMRAIGALDHRLALRISIEDNARPGKIHPEEGVRAKLAREGDREPGLVKAGALLLVRGCAEVASAVIFAS